MIGSAILDEVEQAIVGKREPLELLLMTILAGGHALIEDVPGLGKTLAARAFATATGLHHARVQFTPDLLPSDLTGSPVLDAAGGLTFRRGPVFTNLLLADEINRASPKTQSALLEAMQERQVTSDDGTRPLPRPFHVLATQNPIELEGTYPLPEAQLDRFLARVSFGYPSADDEWEVLRRHGSGEVELRSVLDRDGLLELQRSLEDVHVAELVGRYMVALVTASTRASSWARARAARWRCFGSPARRRRSTTATT